MYDLRLNEKYTNHSIALIVLFILLIRKFCYEVELHITSSHEVNLQKVNNRLFDFCTGVNQSI